MFVVSAEGKGKVPISNQVSCHEDVWASGGIAPHILKHQH